MVDPKIYSHLVQLIEIEILCDLDDLEVSIVMGVPQQLDAL